MTSLTPFALSLLLVIIHIGLSALIFLFLQAIRIPIEAIKTLFLERELKENLPNTLFDEGYLEESPKKLRKATNALANKKLYELNSSKSIQRKLSDLKSVAVLNLPPNPQRIRLLNNALIKQKDISLKYEIAIYKNKLQRDLFFQDISLSFWTSSIIYLYSLYNYRVLDNLLAIQLIIFISIFFILLFSSTIITYNKPRRVLVSCLFVILIYFYIYSINIHSGTTKVEIKSPGITMECPAWIKKENVEACNDFVYIKSNSQSPTNVKVLFDDNLFYLKDQDCKISPTNELNVSSLNSSTFFLSPKNEKSLLPQYTSLNLEVLNTNGAPTSSSPLICSINLENPVWSYMRSILSAITGATTIISILIEVIKSTLDRRPPSSK